MTPARYFPVLPAPLRMKADLLPFGTDFGNGTADRLFFQSDAERSRYLEAKVGIPLARHWSIDELALGSVHEAALEWLRTTIDREHPRLLPAAQGSTLSERYHEVLSVVQEDVAVIHRGTGSGRAVMMHVSFPSGWHPEALRGADFMRIHQPVPGFSGERLGRSMIEAMIDRGPFVRFVWTVAADDALDHHPDDGRRPGWSDATERGWLRVERQVTVPLRPVDSAIFLIRTYLYPLESLTLEERRTLSIALREMPEEIAAYKGLLAKRLRRFGVRLGAGERLDHLPVLEQLELVGDRVTVRIGRRGPLEVDLSGRDIRTRT